MVERQLPKLNVAGSIPVSRSNQAQLDFTCGSGARKISQSFLLVTSGQDRPPPERTPAPQQEKNVYAVLSYLLNLCSIPPRCYAQNDLVRGLPLNRTAAGSD